MTHTAAWALVFIAAGLTAWTTAVFTGVLGWRLRANLRAALARRARQPLRLRIVEREDSGPDLFRIVLAREGLHLRLPAFAAGQYLTVLLPDGVSRRCYSLADWHKRPDRYELAIRREPEGAVSQWLHAHAHPGRRLSVLPPRGEFVLDPAEVRGREIVLIAGGIGITPLRAMARRLAALAPAGRPSRLTLIYAVRYEPELLYREEFECLAGTNPWFRFVPLVSRPGAEWHGRCGRINAAVIASEMANPENALFFICASNAMLDHVVSELRGMNVAGDHVRYERFSADVGNADTRRYRIVLDDAPALTFSAQSSLLRFFEQQGVAIAADCRAGSCGLCRLRLLEGEIVWTIHPECDPGTGNILACCTVPCGDLRLRLDRTTGDPGAPRL